MLTALREALSYEWRGCTSQAWQAENTEAIICLGVLFFNHLDTARK